MDSQRVWESQKLLKEPQNSWNRLNSSGKTVNLKTNTLRTCKRNRYFPVGFGRKKSEVKDKSWLWAHVGHVLSKATHRATSRALVAPSGYQLSPLSNAPPRCPLHPNKSLSSKRTIVAQSSIKRPGNIPAAKLIRKQRFGRADRTSADTGWWGSLQISGILSQFLSCGYSQPIRIRTLLEIIFLGWGGAVWNRTYSSLKVL